MGIQWKFHVVADARLTAIYGARAAGGFTLRLQVDFDVHGWDQQPPVPQVVLTPARVFLRAQQQDLGLGTAAPQIARPFAVSQYAHARQAATYELDLSPKAMEAIERKRDGAGVTLLVRVQAEVRAGNEFEVVVEDVQHSFSVSQWLAALEQADYGRFLLFDVPIPSGPQSLGSVLEHMETARLLLMQGHYAESVAKCRMVLEGLTKELNHDAALATAIQLQKSKRTLEQRELAMRQAAMDFCSLAHHPTGASHDEQFDRNSAQMILGTTAALVSSALAREASALHQS